MRSQVISQFYLHTLRSSANRAGTHLPTLEGWKTELALDGWLVTYRNKCLIILTVWPNMFMLNAGFVRQCCCKILQSWALSFYGTALKFFNGVNFLAQLNP